ANGKPAVAKTGVNAYELDMLKKASAAKMPEGVDNVHIAKLLAEGPGAVPKGVELKPGEGVAVMEKAKGVALKDYILGVKSWEGGKITPEEWGNFKKAVEGLKQQGVEHTDLKNSENVQVWRDGKGKLQFEIIDWGGPVDPKMRMPDAQGLKILETDLLKAGLLDTPKAAPAAAAAAPTAAQAAPNKIPNREFELFVRREYGIDTGTLQKTQPQALQKILKQYISENRPPAAEVQSLRLKFGGGEVAQTRGTAPDAWKKNLQDKASFDRDTARLNQMGSEIRVKTGEGTGLVVKEDFRQQGAPEVLYSGQNPEIVELMLKTGAFVPKMYHEGRSYADYGGVENAMMKHVVGESGGFVSVSSSKKGAESFGQFVLEIDPKKGNFYSTHHLS